ncbi:MAG: monovalent cation/H(+) antiporter subunit G [Coraliomargarita sp.]
MDWLVAILMVTGMFFAFVASLGLVRMPDLYTRIHAATKAGAFGSSVILFAAALHFGSLRAAIMAVLVVVFFYLTTPVAAQALSDAAHRLRISQWSGTKLDELADDEADDVNKSNS